MMLPPVRIMVFCHGTHIYVLTIFVCFHDTQDTLVVDSQECGCLLILFLQLGWLIQKHIHFLYPNPSYWLCSNYVCMSQILIFIAGDLCLEYNIKAFSSYPQITSGRSKVQAYHSRGICDMCLKFMKKSRKITTCNWFMFKTSRESRTILKDNVKCILSSFFLKRERERDHNL